MPRIKEKKYRFKTENSMRKIRRNWHETGLAVHNSGSMKTMLCGVRINSPKFLNSKNLLNNLLNKSEKFKMAVAADLKKIFDENPTQLAVLAAGQYWPEYPTEKELQKKIARVVKTEPLKEEDDFISTEFSCPDCGEPLMVWQYFREGVTVSKKSKKLKPFFLLRCFNYQDKYAEQCGYSLKCTKKKKIKESGEETFIFETTGFKAKNIYGLLYNWYVAKNDVDRPKAEQFIPDFRSPVGASVANEIAKNIAGFLERYFNEKRNLLKIHQKNKKTIRENENQEAIFFEKLPNSIENLKDYNIFISEYNIWLNHQKQTKPNTNFQFLKKLKGLPSFPFTKEEKPTEKRSFLDLKVFCLNFIPGARDYWESEKASWEEFCKRYSSKKINEKTYKSKPNHQKIIKQTRHLIEKGKSNKEIFEFWLSHFIEKIDKLTYHLETSGIDQQERFIDRKALVKGVDAIRTFGIILLTQFERGSLLYSKNQTAFNLLAGQTKGSSQFVKTKNQIFEIMGFSNNFSQGGAVVFRKNQQDKDDWFLAINLLKDQKGPKITKDKQNQNFFGFDHKGKIHPIFFDTESTGSILIPLAFSSHRGQEFLWNKNLSLMDGQMRIANARVIKNEREEKDTYQVALSMEKVVQEKKPLQGRMTKNFLGVYPGEIIPANCVLTDSEGNFLSFEKMGTEFFLTQEKLFQLKSTMQQNQGGIIETKKPYQSKNISKYAIGILTREILSLATKKDALILTEEPNESTFRGKRSFIMSLRQQKNLWDKLEATLNYEGMKTTDWLNKVFGIYASETCSACGFVHAAKFVKIFSEKFQLENSKKLPKKFLLQTTNTEIPVPTKFSYFFLKNKKYYFDSVDSLSLWQKAISQKDVKNRIKKFYKFFGQLLNSHPRIGEFRCSCCDFKVDRELQASLNLIRLAKFHQSSAYITHKKKKTEFYNSNKTTTEPSYAEDWMNFYQKMISKGTWKPLEI